MVEGIVWKKTRAAIAEGRLFSAVGFLEAGLRMGSAWNAKGS